MAMGRAASYRSPFFPTLPVTAMSGQTITGADGGTARGMQPVRRPDWFLQRTVRMLCQRRRTRDASWARFVRRLS